MNFLSHKLCRDLETEVTEILDKLGIFYRVFTRVKTQQSIDYKMSTKNYSDSKKMQDLFGIRIATYFKSDVHICDQIISKHFQNIVEDNSIDKYSDDKFRAVRHNKIYELPINIKNEISEDIKHLPIDLTFEVQYRTILSEGWHEVEHDMRYKNRSDWDEHFDSSRHLNGILATLETCDWSIEHLFDELAYKHYKNSNWIAMVKNKFRIRIVETDYCSEIFQNNLTNELAKKLFKLEREEFFKLIEKYPLKFSFKCSDILFITNYFIFHDQNIIDVTPHGLIQVFLSMDIYNEHIELDTISEKQIMI